MRKSLLLYFVLLMGLIPALLPTTTEAKDFFLFSDMKLYFATHIYFIIERLTLILLAWLIASDEVKNRLSVQVFFWLVSCDLLDYVLTYNSIWFHLYIFPVSMNTVSVFIFGLVILREWIKLNGSPYFG